MNHKRFIVAILLSSCGQPPLLALNSIAPNQLRAGQFATLTVRGTGFELLSSVDIDSPKQTNVNTAFSIDARNATSHNAFSRIDWLDDMTLKGGVPSVPSPPAFTTSS